MTVFNKTNFIRANGDGADLTFEFSFPVKTENDVVVKKIVNSTGVATTLIISNDYSVTLNTITEGGTITYVVAPTALEDSFIKRATVQDQQTALPIGGNFPEISVENEIDRSRMIDIELQEQISRCIIISETETLTNINAPMGTSAANRGTLLWGWDANGTGLTLYAPTIVDAVSVIATKGDMVQGSDTGTAEQLTIGDDDDRMQIVSGKAAWVSSAGRWDLIQTQTASTDASIDFTGLTSTYQSYMLIISDLLGVTDAAFPLCRISTLGVFNTGASEYDWGAHSGWGTTADANDTGLGDVADSAIRISSTTGTGSNESGSGTFFINDLANASFFTSISGIGGGKTSAAVAFVSQIFGRFLIAEANDGIQVFMSSGNILSGTFKLYGLRA